MVYQTRFSNTTGTNERHIAAISQRARQFFGLLFTVTKILRPDIRGNRKWIKNSLFVYHNKLILCIIVIAKFSSHNFRHIIFAAKVLLFFDIRKRLDKKNRIYIVVHAIFIR